MHYVMPVLVVVVIVVVIGACWQKSSSVKRMLPKAKQFLKDHFEDLAAKDGLADYRTIGEGRVKYPEHEAEIAFLQENIGGIGHVYKKDKSQTAKNAATTAVAGTAPQLAGVTAISAVASDSTVHVISRADLDAEHSVDFLGQISKRR